MQTLTIDKILLPLMMESNNKFLSSVHKNWTLLDIVINPIDELELEDKLKNTIAVPFYKAKITKNTF
jgi:hypothetical protein